MAVSGCDLFQTRDPQQPAQTKSSFNTPVTADIVIDNLKSAIAEYNVDNYIRCFVDTAARPYEFIASQEIQGNYPGVFSHWTLENERQYYVRMGQPAGGAPYLSDSTLSSIVGSDSVMYLMSYTLFFPHTRTDIPKVVQGNMQLSLGVNNQGLWSIYRWQDFKTVSNSTWSLWKAVFSGS